MPPCPSRPPSSYRRPRSRAPGVPEEEISVIGASFAARPLGRGPGNGLPLPAPQSSLRGSRALSRLERLVGKGRLMPPPPEPLGDADDGAGVVGGDDVAVLPPPPLLLGVAVAVAVGRGLALCRSWERTEMTEPFRTSPVGLTEVTVASGLVEPESETPKPRAPRLDRTSPSRRPT